MVWGEGELGGFDVLGCELECPERQGRSQCQGGGGEGGARGRRGGGRLWGYSILGLAAKLEGICESLFMCPNKAGQVLQAGIVSVVVVGPAMQIQGTKGPGLTLMKSCPSSVFSFSMVDEESD